MPSSAFNPKEYWENRFSNGVGFDTTGFIGMGSAYNEALYRCYASALRLLLRRHSLDVGPETTVIDAGAGSGFIEKFCQKRGVSALLGLDFTAHAVSYLQEHFPSYRFLQQDLTQTIPTDVPPGDITFCLSVLYHIVEVPGFEMAVSNLSRSTKTGGYVIIADNFMPVLQPTIPGSHQRHWSQEEFAVALKKANLEVISYQPIFFCLNAPLRFGHRPIGKNFLSAWTWVQKHVAGNEFRSKVVANVALVIDLLFQRICREGPSSHYLLCRKSADHVST